MGYRYIGAKTRLIGAVVDRVKRELKPAAVVADLMTGTGAVAGALANEGYRVIANDVMTYSYHHARAILMCDKPPGFKRVKLPAPPVRDDLFRARLPRYERALRYLESLRPLNGYFWREFSLAGAPLAGVGPRNYFTPANAALIDAIRTQIRVWTSERRITSIERSVLLHDLILAANDVANIAGTYGHYLAKTITRSTRPLKLTPTRFDTVRYDARHRVLRGYAEDVAPNLSCDLCYIDPPYIKRQYAANYHILETLARDDDPEAIGVSGLRPWRDQYSDFCTKTKIREAFEKIIVKMDCTRFLISYSEDGLISIKDLTALLERHGTVSVEEITNKRFKSNGNENASHVVEYLISLNKSSSISRSRTRARRAVGAI